MMTFPAVSAAIKNYKFTENAFLPKFVTIPLACENDTECKCIVKPGERVNEGDVIGIPLSGTQRASKIHASIPGTVVDILPCVNSNGKVQKAVKIQLDGKFQFLGKKLEAQDYKKLSADKICSLFFENGVVNTFNVAGQECLGSQLQAYLAAKKSDQNLPLVVRLFDEDTMRLTDSLVSKFYAEKIVEASKILSYVMGTSDIVFVRSLKDRRKNERKKKNEKPVSEKVKAADSNNVSDNEDSSADFNASTENSNLNMKNFVEKTIDDFSWDGFKYENLYVDIKKYPAGTPREIISAFNKNLKKTCGYSITRDCIFIDASTLIDVYDSVVLGMPVLGKNVHLSGDCLYSSCLLNVRTGTTLRDIVFQLGGFEKKPSLIIINGLISGTEVSSLDMPVTKSVKSVSFISGLFFTDTHVCSCIRCGQCRNACPVKIQPDVLYRELSQPVSMEKSIYAQAANLCTDCGLCNSVCPSRLPLCQTIGILKEKYKDFNDVKAGEK